MQEWYNPTDIIDKGGGDSNSAKRRDGQGVIAKLIGDPGSFGIDSKKRV